MAAEFKLAHAFAPEHLLGLEALSKTGKDAVLFGGQAVYFWADRYRARCPKLESFMPFTSKDVDALIVDVSLLEQLKKWGKVVRSTSPADGQYAIFTPKGSKVLPVDLFTTVYGFSSSQSLALVKESQLVVGSLRVLHPVDLLIAKAYNIANLPQEGRNDKRHLKIMQIVVRAFFLELLEMLEQGALEPRAVLWEVKRLFRLSNRSAIRAILAPHLVDMVPVAAFRRCQSPKIVAFCKVTLGKHLGE